MKKVKKVCLIMAGGGTCDYTQEFKDYYTDDIEKTSNDITKGIRSKEVITVKRNDNRMVAIYTDQIVGVGFDFIDVEEGDVT